MGDGLSAVETAFSTLKVLMVPVLNTSELWLRFEGKCNKVVVQERKVVRLQTSTLDLRSKLATTSITSIVELFCEARS